MTAWPLIWTIEPATPNWVGTVGDMLEFTVSAIPDPSYPDSLTGDEGGGVPITPIEPTNIQLSIINSTIDEEFYDINGATLSVNVDDVRIFLPFTSIKFEKDGEIHQVQYEKDLNEIGYDFVFEFIPYPNAFDERSISLRATSTSDTDLVGTFIFRINNNFDAVRSSLIDIVDNGDLFLSNLEDGDGTPPEINEAEQNETTIVTPVFGGSYTEPNYDELFPTSDSAEIDELARNGDSDELSEKIGDGGTLKKTPPTNNEKTTSLPENPSDNDLRNWFDNLGN